MAGYALRTIGFLFFLSGLLSGSEQRDVSVRVLVDEEFRALPRWEEKTAQALDIASQDFERRFGLRFKIAEILPWASDDFLPSLDEMAGALDASVRKGSAEIVIALTAQDMPDRTYCGYSLFREGIIVVRETAGSVELSRILKHELCHLFGAVHVIDPASIMDVHTRGQDVDAVNAQIIRLCRDRNFNPVPFPIARENLEDVVRLYREAARKNGAALAGPTGETTEGNLTSLLDIKRRLDDAHLLLAQVHIELREYEEAIRECRAARSMNPDNLEGLNLMGIALRKNGDIERAIACYKEILDREPAHARVHYNLGIALSKSGDALSALESYSRALELKPNFAEAHCNSGDILLRLDRVDEAEASLVKAVDLNPEFALAHSNLAEVYWRRRQFLRALEFAEKAVRLDPDLADARNMLGKALNAVGERERAKVEYLEAVRLDPSNEKAHYNLGNAFLRQGMTAEAKTYYERALAIREDLAEAHAGLGTCFLQEERYDDAVRELERSLELGSESAATRLNLSTAFLKKGMIGEALAEARRALGLDPGLVSARNNAGIALLLQDRPDDAENELRLALEADPKNKETLANLANLVFSRARNEEAVELFKKALEADPANASLHNNLAVAYFRTGEYRSAQEHVRRAQALGFRVHSDFLKELEKKLKK